MHSFPIFFDLNDQPITEADGEGEALYKIHLLTMPDALPAQELWPLALGADGPRDREAPFPVREDIRDAILRAAS